MIFHNTKLINIGETWVSFFIAHHCLLKVACCRGDFGLGMGPGLDEAPSPIRNHSHSPERNEIYKVILHFVLESTVTNGKGYFYRRESSTNGKNKGQEAIIRVSGEISPALSQQPPQSRVCIRGNSTKVGLRGEENR